MAEVVNMPWYKYEKVEDGIVRAREYRYLNDRGNPVNEIVATKCMVTEYDEEGKVVYESIKLGMPLRQYYLKFSLGIFLLVAYQGFVNMKFLPEIWYISFLANRFAEILIWFCFGVITYMLFRTVAFKESYLVLWNKETRRVICGIYLYLILLMGAVYLKWTWCYKIMLFSMVVFGGYLILEKLYKSLCGSLKCDGTK